MTAPTDIEAPLRQAVTARMPDARGIENLSRMLGGASKEVWALDVATSAGTLPLVLRRGPNGQEFVTGGLSLTHEAGVIAAMGAAGVPVPRVHFVSEPGSPLGAAFVMDRVAGVNDPMAIAHDPALEQVRAGLAFEVGAACARMQGVPLESLPPLCPALSVDALYAAYDDSPGRSAVIELSLRWLGDNAPPPLEPVIAHGDFRNGNLIIDDAGLAGIIDWEFAHPGDPLEDLAFLCLAPWRFGRLDRVAGGFGALEALFDGYTSVRGGHVDLERFRYCQVLHMARWSIGTSTQLQAYRSGADASLERGLVGRRLSETELDLLDLLEGIA